MAKLSSAALIKAWRCKVSVVRYDCVRQGSDEAVYLLCVPRTHGRLDLPEAIADEQCPVNKHAIGRSIDLEIAEEDIGAEKGEDLVDTIVGLVVGRDVQVRSIGWKRGQSVCGTASASSQRQNREVPCNIVRQFETLEVPARVAVAGGARYLSQGHRGPPRRWSDMPEKSVDRYHMCR